MKEVLLFAIILIQLSIPFSAEPNGLTIDLIHWNSPLSPFYNSSMTQSDILISAAFRSKSRVKYFKFNPDQISDDTTTIPNEGSYLMQFFIGTPPKGSFATADTGSNLIWVQCLPCQKCYPQSFPVFDPRNSYTHHLIPCNNNTCNNLLYKHYCGIAGECIYEIHYGDNSFSKGTLSTDTITFNTTFDGQIIEYPDTILGCGYNNAGRFKPTVAGIFGLGSGPLSFISQHGDKFGKRKFSYCLLPYHFVHGANKMKFGVDTQTYRRGVVTTPLVTKPQLNHYYLSLEGVSINGKVLQPAEQTVGNIVIDSGTTLTFLKSSWYYEVEAAFVEAIGDQSVAVSKPIEPFNLCYKDDGSIETFPTVTFQFSGAANEMQLSAINLFLTIDDLMCFVMAPSDEISILGNLQQVFFNIEYDLDQKTVSFAKANCLKE